jgi:ethanolamine ammonia-lyase large subunit
VSYRPLAFVSGLTLGDYLLWNWSLNANHDVLALVSGLTLPPLALACAWMIAMTLIRIVGGTTRRSGRSAASIRARATAERVAADARSARATAAAGGPDGAAASTGASPSSSRKLAA